MLQNEDENLLILFRRTTKQAVSVEKYKKSTLLFFMRVAVKATAIPAKKVAQFPIDKNLRDAATSSDSSS